VFIDRLNYVVYYCKHNGMTSIKVYVTELMLENSWTCDCGKAKLIGFLSLQWTVQNIK